MIIENFQEIGKLLNAVIPAPGLANIRSFAQAATHLETVVNLVLELIEKNKELTDENISLKTDSPCPVLSCQRSETRESPKDTI